MKKSITLLIFSMILLILPITLAADIKGNVYDINLNLATNTILKINTIPEQTFVSKDGSYTFTIKPGDYIITAEYKEHTINKEIKIIEEGSYVLDLILLDIPAVEPKPTSETKISYWWYIGIIVIIIILSIAFKKLKPNKKEKQEDDLTKKVLKFIKEQGGRTTQKDIRKKFPMSEAKISLVITELEHQKIIRKIKKGRGNVIILQ